MFETFTSILSSVEFWKIAAPAVTAIVAWLLNEKNKRTWERWQIKKVACLKALNLANAVLSNYGYQNVGKGAITPQYENIENARSCFNELACTCDEPDVINALKKIMFENPSIDSIVDLRNAVRKELKFSNKTIDSDREKAFVGKINCEKQDGT